MGECISQLESVRPPCHQRVKMDVKKIGMTYTPCRAIELIYLMCELESSVVFVDHAARVFKEASENFEELKLRIQDQLRFQSYIEARSHFNQSEAIRYLCLSYLSAGRAGKPGGSLVNSLGSA